MKTNDDRPRPPGPPPAGRRVEQSTARVETEVESSMYRGSGETLLGSYSVRTLFDGCLPDSDGKWRRACLRLVRACKCDLGLSGPDAASDIFGQWTERIRQNEQERRRRKPEYTLDAFTVGEAWAVFSKAWAGAKIGLLSGPVFAAVNRARHDRRPLGLPAWADSDPTTATIGKALRIIHEQSEPGEAFAPVHKLAVALGVSVSTAAAAFNLLVDLGAVEITAKETPNRARRYRWKGSR